MMWFLKNLISINGKGPRVNECIMFQISQRQILAK